MFAVVSEIFTDNLPSSSATGFVLTASEWLLVIIIVPWLYAATCSVGMSADMTWLVAHSIGRFGSS